MKPGPPPKPSNLKKLSGNPGRRPLNDAEPQFPVPGRMLNVPDYLDTYGAEVWRDLGKLLLDAGLFTKVDQWALGMFCSSAGLFQEACIHIKTEGSMLYNESGTPYQSPWIYQRNQAWGQMQKMFGHFGLTPAERARLKVTVRDEEPSLGEQLFNLALGEDDD